MFSTIDRCARTAVSWPLALAGLVLSFCSEWLIRAAAWIADVNLEDKA